MRLSKLYACASSLERDWCHESYRRMDGFDVEEDQDQDQDQDFGRRKFLEVCDLQG